METTLQELNICSSATKEAHILGNGKVYITVIRIMETSSQYPLHYISYCNYYFQWGPVPSGVSIRKTAFERNALNVHVSKNISIQEETRVGNPAQTECHLNTALSSGKRYRTVYSWYRLQWYIGYQCQEKVRKKIRTRVPYG